MWIKNVFLLFFGLCAGGIIAAGVYAFLAIIGVFVRMIGKTKTKKHIMLYEDVYKRQGYGSTMGRKS